MIPVLFAVVLTFFLSHLNVESQELKAYQIFDKEGQKASFTQLTAQSAQNEVILFGELHNNPIVHWLQLELSRELYDKTDGKLIMGLEMFESDNQLLIDEYFAGLITERNFRAEVRLWSNYQTDIKPLLDYALEHEIKLVATNIPRRYASLVNREGFKGLEGLSAEALRYVAPLPVPYDPELPGYKAMLEMGGMPGHTSENFPKAQAIKDATMAHFILENLAPGHTFIHFHGTYHSDNYEGIVWYLQENDYQQSILTISSVEQEQLESLDEENHGVGDFIIAVPQSMTKTH